MRTERDIIQDGVEWRVREADAAHVPGARRDHCLIFDSDGVVRRVWAYPADWQDLSDDRLWSLLRNPSADPTGRAEHSAEDHPAVATATAELARARMRAARLALVTDVDATGARAQRADTSTCDQIRESLRLAIHGYAETLRLAGVPPERAVVMIKAAMRDGLGSAGACEDFEDDEIIREGVAWGIESYYAA